MRAMLHGYRRVDMVSPDNGQPINGFSCFFGYPSQGVEGEECSKQFVADAFAQSCGFVPRVGQVYDLEFTPRGKVGSIATATVREK